MGLVYDTGPQSENGPIPCLRAVTGQEGRFRLLNMDLNRLTTSGRSLWGGRVHYRLEWADGNPSGALAKGVGRLSQGDFSVRIRPRTRDQVGELTRAFNDMARRLEQADAERRAALRMEEELKVAREVQMRLLPDLDRLRLPGAVHASILPAREVAGDYYDVLRLQDGTVALLIADVSGKGTSAAFYAAETKGVLAALDKLLLGPREVPARINEIWWHGHPRSLFMTLAYGCFDPHGGACSFVRAGHPPAFLRRADGMVERLLPQGMGVGLSWC